MAELPVIQSIRICSKIARYYSFPKSALPTTNITFCDKYLMTLDIRRYVVRFYDVLEEALQLSDKNEVFVIKTNYKSSQTNPMPKS